MSDDFRGAEIYVRYDARLYVDVYVTTASLTGSGLNR